MTAKQNTGAGSTTHARRFALGVGVALATVVALGWLTGLRGALHALLILSGALALFPLLLLSAAVLLLLGGSLLAALVAPDTDLLTAGAADGIATGGSKLVRGYYGLLWRLRRHPLAWGVGAGVGLGGLGLLAALWLFVVPREAKTLGILLEAQAQLDAEHRSTRRYPEAAPEGYLPAAFAPAGGEPAGAARDGFGRPILYQRAGSWLTASYTLTSFGFDGKPSADDICVTGRTRLGGILERLRGPLDLVSALRAGRLTFGEQTRALQDTRCARLPERAQL